MGLAVQFVPVPVTPATTWLFVSLGDGEQTGWGEATLAGQERAVTDLSNALPKHIRETDLGSLPFHSLPNAALSSALRQAYADLSARNAGLALSDTLGGTVRRNIGVYANINRCTVDRSPAGMAASASHALARGHVAIKIAPFDEVRPNLARADMTRAMELGLERIQAVRMAIGDRRLMVDCHWRFDIPGAETLIDAVAGLRLHWIECPIAESEDAIPALKALRARANSQDIRLAGLETAILQDGFTPYLSAGAYDVMMPDVKYCGGPQEMLVISALMARSRVEFSPHNPSGPICHAHSLHVCAALPECGLLETQFAETPFFDSLVEHALPQPDQGQVALPDKRSGLGVAVVQPEMGMPP